MHIANEKKETLTKLSVLIYYYLSFVLLYFFISFLLPVSSKFVNNGFYIAIALPTLTYFLRRGRYKEYLSPANNYFFLAVLTLTLIALAGGVFDRGGVYLGLFFLSVVWCKEHKISVQAVLNKYSAVLALLVAIIVAMKIESKGVSFLYVQTIKLTGQASNPAYAGSLIAFLLCYAWFFLIMSRSILVDKQRILWPLFIVLGCMVLLLFMERSPIVGFISFCVAWSICQKQLRLPGFLAIAFILITGLALLMDSGFVQRGFSYRLDIWEDALTKLWSDCGLLLGCGENDYKFKGRFFHTHSAFVGILYTHGIIPFTFTFIFIFKLGFESFRDKNRWFFIAIPGLVALFFTTGGLYSSPKLFWVYFWLPIFLALTNYPDFTIHTGLMRKKSSN